MQFFASTASEASHLPVPVAITTYYILLGTMYYCVVGELVDVPYLLNGYVHTGSNF